MAVTHLNDDLDMAGHHIVDWRYLSDIPSGGAATGQSLVFNGKTWAPATVSGGSGGPVDWADIVGVPLTFPPDAHSHVSADVTDWLTTDLVVHTASSLNEFVANVSESDDPRVLRAVNGTGSDGSVWFHTTSLFGWHIENPLYIGNVTTANALLVMGNTADNSGEIRIGTSVLTNHSSRGLVVASHAYIGGNFHIVGTSTLVGASTHTGGVITNTVSERTAASGVTIDGVLLKDYGVVSAYTGAGASKTNIAASQTIVTSGNDFTSVYKGYDATVNLTAASGTLSTITVRGYDCNITMTNGTPTFFTAQVFPLRCAVDMGGLLMGGYTGNDGPVTIKNSNPNSGQAFGTGYLSVDVYGTTGDVIAAYTRANVTGSAKGIGYRGYATGVSGGTGEVIGVNGYANIVSGAAHTAVMSFDALVFGTAVGIGKRMALRGADHVLIQGGSLILASGTPATPDAVTTTHLTLTAKNSNLYAAGSAEIDGETFMDGNTSCSISAISASANAGTATFIIVDATSAAVTVTLPTASGKAGRMYTIKKIDASANIVTVDGNGAETVDGAADAQLTTQYQVVRVICNGTTWWIV